MNSTPASALRNGNRGFAPGVVRAGTVAWHLVGIALAVLLAGWVAGRLMPVLLPVGIAVLLSALLRPLAAGLERRGVAPAPAAIGSVALALVIIAGLAWLIVPPFVAQLSDLGTSLDDGMRRLAYSLGHDVAGLDHAQVDRMLHDAGQSIRQNLGGLAGSALAGAAAVLALIPTAVLVVFVCFFLVKDGRRIWSWLLALVPEARRSDVDEMGSRAWSVLGVYAKGVVFVATIDAVFIGIALLIVGVPLALPLIVLTWLAAFFPIIGGWRRARLPCWSRSWRRGSGRR